VSERRATDQAADPRQISTSESRRGLVLMADRSDEAGAIAELLRGEGLSVLSCDVIALPERASRADPVAILVDLEQANVSAAIQRVQEQRTGEPAELECMLLLLGTPAMAGEMGLSDLEDVEVLERPVVDSNLLSLLRKRLGYASLTGLAAPSSFGSSPLSSPLASDSGAAILSDFPAIAGLPEVAGILPELGGPLAAPAASELSPEIESLLSSSAQRVAESDPDVGPSALAADMPVPPEMMAMIDDLLAPEQSPPTDGGMSLAAMFQSEPSDSVPPPEDDEPSYDSFNVASGYTSADSSARGSDAPKTSARTNIADEKTNVPTLGTQVGPPMAAAPPFATQRGPLGPHIPPSGTLDGTQPFALEGATFPLPPSAQAHPAQPQSAPLGSRPLSGPVASTMRHPHQFPAGGFGVQPPSTDRAAVERRDPRAAQVAPGYPATDRRRPMSTRPPGARTQLGPPSDRPPESIGRSSERAPLTRAHDPAFAARVTGDSAMPRTAAYQPMQELAAAAANGLPEHGDPIDLLAIAVSQRATGSLVLTDAAGERVRRVLMRDGDVSNAASDHPDDALLVFLVERGDLRPEVARMRSVRVPQTGRHAAAALIANGLLSQDDLWPVLRAHAEWILGRALLERPSRCHLEDEPPERLLAEPNVFGGAAGVEVLVESVRRTIGADEALSRLGGAKALLAEGPNLSLLSESALDPDEIQVVRSAPGQPVGQVLAGCGPDMTPVIVALVALRILEVHARRRPSSVAPPSQGIDPLDVDAVRQRVQARIALVQDADYFALLGLPLNATAYDIRRAYLELRRAFEPSRLITAATLDLLDDAELIVEVLDEAYEILRDPQRRIRYRRAIEATRS
jgi:hypothetical protein